MARAANDPRAALDAISLAAKDSNTKNATLMVRGVKDTAAKNFKLTMKRMKKTPSRELQESAKAWWSAWEESQKFLARDDFISFMEYVELDRPINQRFWVPRQKALTPVAKALQEIADGKLDELILNMPPRVGKLLADDTPILTTKGWKCHGDLVVGDYVFGLDGKPHKVTHVHPKSYADMAVSFSNGERILCSSEHEWYVLDKGRKRTWRIAETQDMCGMELLPESSEERYRYALPPIEAIDVPDAELPMEPYSLGAWLGAGANKYPNIKVWGDPVVERIRQDGYRVTVMDVENFGYKMATIRDYKVDSAIGKMGLWSNKRIPDAYFTASKQQRLELLAGLVDSCGDTRRQKGVHTLNVESSELAEDIVAFVATFGWRGRIGKGRKFGKDMIGVAFSPTQDLPTFVDARELDHFAIQHRVRIVDISPIKPVSGNCITVEGEMYLAGRTLLPTHNSTIMTFFMAWMCGRDTEASHLYTSYSSTVTEGFYNGFHEIVTDKETYRWGKVFPSAQIVATNANSTTIDLARKKRYPTLTCRSIYGSLNGTCDASGLMIADDLCSGYEEAVNASRMGKLNDQVNSDWLSRRKEGCPIIWMGTRWSILDPIGQRESILETEPAFKNVRWKKILLPALDENDESNFDSDSPAGFSTEYFHQIRAQFERRGEGASWLAVYMQQPVDRKGAIFDPDTLNIFSGDVAEGRTFMAVDPAFGGGDFTASPVCRVIDGKVYVLDVVFSSAEKDETMPLIAQKASQWHVGEIHFEANKVLSSYIDEFRKIASERCPGTLVTSAPAPSNSGSKSDRILSKAPDIRANFLFRATEERTGPYRQFMEQVGSFVPNANKHVHDDAPDALAQAASMVFTTAQNAPTFFRR